MNGQTGYYGKVIASPLPTSPKIIVQYSKLGLFKRSAKLNAISTKMLDAIFSTKFKWGDDWLNNPLRPKHIVFVVVKCPLFPRFPGTKLTNSHCWMLNAISTYLKYFWPKNLFFVFICSKFHVDSRFEYRYMTHGFFSLSFLDIRIGRILQIYSFGSNISTPKILSSKNESNI